MGTVQLGSVLPQRYWCWWTGWGQSPYWGGGKPHCRNNLIIDMISNRYLGAGDDVVVRCEMAKATRARTEEPEGRFLTLWVKYLFPNMIELLRFPEIYISNWGKILALQLARKKLNLQLLSHFKKNNHISTWSFLVFSYTVSDNQVFIKNTFEFCCGCT